MVHLIDHLITLDGTIPLLSIKEMNTLITLGYWIRDIINYTPIVIKEIITNTRSINT